MNADPSDILSALQRTQFIRSRFLSAEDRLALAEIAAAPRTLRTGVDFVSEDARTDTVYLLTGGWACRYKTTRDGARQITGLVVPGDICNLDSFMLAQVNFAVRTLTAATAIGLPRDGLQALATERPGIARAFTWFAVVENAILSAWALSLGRKNARERLAHLLCEMAVRLDDRCGSRAEFALPITQEQIADVLGLTPVHINRTIRQLRADGLIAVEHRRITVPNMVELSRLGGFNGAYLHAVPSSYREEEDADRMERIGAQ